IAFIEKQVSELLGAYSGGRLQGLAGIIDFELHLGDRWVPCGGIAGVAARPEHRRRGMVRELLVECLRRLHQREVPVAGLWPFSYPFYAQFGWAVSDLQQQIDAPLKVLPKTGDSRSYHMISLDDFDKVMPI